MPLLGQLLLALLIVSLLCTYLALRGRDWRFGVVAALLSLPIALVAQVNYGALLLAPILQLACTLALRWKAGPIAWFSLLVLGAAFWLIGAASPLLWDWSAGFYVVYLVGFIAGLAALIWHRPPWPNLRSRSFRRPS